MVFKLLTYKQAQVLRMLCEGIPEDQIAVRLNLKIETIWSHRESIRDRILGYPIVEICQFAKDGTMPTGPHQRPPKD